MNNIIAAENKSILLVDDRDDVLEGVKAYIESTNHQLLTSKSLAEAEVLLRENYFKISSTFVDFKLRNENGLNFILSEKKKYHKISFFLITAWTIDKDTSKIIKENNIEVYDKSFFNPLYLIDPAVNPVLEILDRELDGTNNKIPSISNNIFQVSCESSVELKEIIFKERMINNMKNSKIIQMTDTWSKFIEPIISILQLSKDLNKHGIFIENIEYSIDDLIREIKEQTSIGLYLLDLHNSIINDLISKKFLAKENKWSLKRFFFGIGLKH
jgi:response regulator RpfG family c-di-GMP phosphodiesterase